MRKLYRNSRRCLFLLELVKLADANGIVNTQVAHRACQRAEYDLETTNPVQHIYNLKNCGYVKHYDRSKFQIRWAAVKQLMSMKLI